MATNDELKNICQIEHSRHRSFANFITNLIARIAAYSFLPKSNLGKAITYALNEAPGMLHCLKSGEYRLDNNAIERQFKDLITGRKNYLFCEGHSSAQRTASIYSLIGCCKLNNVDPLQYLTDVLGRINDHCHKELEQLLPHNWKPLEK